MQIRSLDSLNLGRSWQRLLRWARGDVHDVPDRLPFELADRIWQGQPALQREHDVQPIHLVMATKPGSQTVRPFARPHVRDLLLYQALVDALLEPINRSLTSPQRIMAHRLSPITSGDALEGMTKWRDFTETVRAEVGSHPGSYVVRGDISSFYVSVDTTELVNRLYAINGNPAVVADLRDLLREWHVRGVRGLPQGVLASGPLANSYLWFLDEALEAAPYGYWRYSDDFVAILPNFSAARSLLDRCERELYSRGMTLGGEKTTIKRAPTAVEDYIPAGERIDASLRALTQSSGDYGPSEGELKDLRGPQLRNLFDDAVIALADDVYRTQEILFALRGLGRKRDAHAVDALVIVLRRLPGLTQEAMRYVTKLRSTDELGVAEALGTILAWEFHRDQEWLHLLRATIHLKRRVLQESSDRLGELALGHGSALVRGHALLAWGRHSDPNDIDIAEAFFQRERRMWLGYAIASLKDKSTVARNRAYDRWRGEGRSIGRVIDSLETQPLSWADM